MNVVKGQFASLENSFFDLANIPKMNLSLEKGRFIMNKLRELRKNKGLLQGDVAKAVDVSQSVYARYESGKVDPPSDTLLKLADFFGVSVDEVLGRPNSAKWKTSPPPQPDYL